MRAPRMLLLSAFACFFLVAQFPSGKCTWMFHGQTQLLPVPDRSRESSSPRAASGDCPQGLPTGLCAFLLLTEKLLAPTKGLPWGSRCISDALCARALAGWAESCVMCGGSYMAVSLPMVLCSDCREPGRTGEQPAIPDR